MDPKADCNTLRDSIKETAQKVKDLAFRFKSIEMREASDPNDQAPDRGEMIANVTLAYRHLEDARMRLGKAIQAYEGREWATPPVAS